MRGARGSSPRMRERVLLLSAGMPPKPVGSAVIVGNLAKQFSRDEMIVTGERPFGRIRMAWRGDWPRLVYATGGWPPGLRGERWWRKLQVPWLLLRCLWLVREHRCTAILVVFPREEFLLAGYLVAVLTRTKLYPYFHNTYLENRVGLSRHFARWLQARVFARAAHVFVMSDGMKELYSERHPHLQCSALPHTFNEVVPSFTPPPEPTSILRVVICGSVSESCRDATVRVCEAIRQIEGASLTLLSGTPGKVLQRLGILRNGVRHESVSRDQVLTRLRDADVMVLPHGFRGALAPEEYRTIFPTRTIEYLISGRPILAHVPADCYLARFLLEHDCALLVTEPTVAALLRAFEQLRADSVLRSHLVRNALRAAKTFGAPRVAGILRRQLNLADARQARPSRQLGGSESGR